MTCGCGVIIVIAVGAARAGIGSITLLGAGRCYCFADLMRVSQRVNVVCHIAVAAIGTPVGGIALCGTGRRCDGLDIVMAKLGDDLGFGLFADRTGPCHLSLTGLGCGHGR